jgi:DNA-binding NarL/FixJ family response regulator
MKPSSSTAATPPSDSIHRRPIRLLLVDDHPVMRAGLANLLAMSGDFAIVGQADDGTAALQMWGTLAPDVCLLDVSMSGMDGIETLRRLRALDPSARVLMLTSSEAAEDLHYALQAGAAGYVTKTVRHDELTAAIREVHAGRRAIGRAVERHTLGGRPAAGLLSPREMEVLGFLRHGYTNAEIGRLLGISERTARAHVAAIMAALDAPDRAGAVAKGFDLGLLKVGSPSPSGGTGPGDR